MTRSLLLLLVVIATWYGSAQAQTLPAGPDAKARCAALRVQDFGQVQDAPAQIISTSVVTLGPGLPETCRIEGYVLSSTGFALLLPLQDWNGKYLQGGCGGACGVIYPWWCNDAIRRGYACLGTDMGHRSGLAEWQWAHDNLALRIDFGFRSTHVASVAGKAIAAAFYSRAPGDAYFMGCSTGGRQALALAQRFPADFDGIVANAPPTSETGSGLQLAWTTLANLDQDGNFILQESQAKLLHAAVVQACDMNDGVIDGLIGDARRCTFDPVALACPVAGSSADGCLSPAQVAAARRMYAGQTDRDGHPLGTQGGVMRGSELYWVGDYMPRGERQPQYMTFLTSFFRHMAFDPAPATNWKLSDLDFERDPARMASSEFLYNAENPDLRGFKARGGKMLTLQGWADTSVAPMGTIDYYDTVTRTMGGLAKTQDFYRLFLVPGMRHCSGDGEGGDIVDTLTALEDWVEHGRAPASLIGHQVSWPGPITSTPVFPVSPALIAKTRVHFPYPDEARYNGNGDPDDSASWHAVPGIPPAVP